MATAVTSGRFHHVRRSRRTWPKVRPVTPQEYEDIRDCCCTKLGRNRPHLAIACRDLD